jgi:hypothetical protein
MSGLSLATTKSIMKRIGNMVNADFQTIGVTEQDFTTATGDEPYATSNKRTVVNVIEGLLFSTLDNAGIPQHALPAEFIAAVVGTFIAPSNQLLACNWMAERSSTGYPIGELANGDDPASLARVSAAQLFALLQLAEADATKARKDFQKRVTQAMSVTG